jgi:hypothetical protein
MNIEADDLNVVSDTLTLSAASINLNSSAGSVDFNTFNTNTVLFRQGAGAGQGLAFDFGTIGVSNIKARANGGQPQPRLDLEGAGINLYGYATGVVVNGTGGLVVLSADIEAFGGNVKAGNNINIGVPGTGGSANMSWNSANGWVRVVTSTKRHKRNISNLNTALDAMYELRPKVYERIHREETDPLKEVGFIAEDAEALGLDHWIEYKDGMVYSFDYYRWTVAQQMMIRDLNDRNKALVQEVTNLKAKVSGEVAGIKTRLANAGIA